MEWWAWCILGVCLFVAVLIVYACCVLSGQISRDEERWRE